MICAYVAFRFEPKYAVPVIIALLHDILITAGVYSLTGREVTSGTVAAFLTILGYSLYDTVIVFDRIRENVPRLPRATFSQIVNRSMSEVLTRSLITGLSSVFLVTVLFIFGGATLKDFAFAMMVGLASGTYSSIFIASPVLTHWKEREPAYRRRRERIEEQMGGVVPAFPEGNVIAAGGGRARGAGAGRDASPSPSPRRPFRAARRCPASFPSRPARRAPAARAAAFGPGRRRGRSTARPLKPAMATARKARSAGSAGAERGERRRSPAGPRTAAVRRRRQQRRRKHGRNR